jgi:hypothetical protein
MKKILFIIYIVLTGTAISHAQVGIGTDKPKGALDLTPETGTAKWGLVLPVVGVVDTVWKAENTATGFKPFPNVTTPGGPITVHHIYDEDISGTVDELLPDEEAPAGTIVYDLSRDGIRVKRTGSGEINGDWCADVLVDSSAVDKSIRYNLYGGTDFRMVDVSAGYNWSVGISADDSLVYATGSNGYYRTGMGRNNGNTQTWTLILSINKAKSVSAGYYHGAAVLKNGDVYVWGYNYYGRTGRGITSGYTQLPTKININLDAGDEVVKVEAGYQNTLFLTRQGKVYVTGYAYRGMLGNGTTSGNYSTPQRMNFSLNAGETIKDISLAARGACVVTSEGRVFAWGNNNSGRLGVGNVSNNNYSTPTLLTFPSGVKIVKAVIGVGSGLAMTTDSLHLYHWGRNLSLGGATGFTTTNQPSPATIPAWESRISGGVLPDGEKIVYITAPRHRDGDYNGDSHLVLTTETVYASGANTAYGTNPGKLGVINAAGGAVAAITAFAEIQDHAIYEETRFTKASIGYTHAFIMTGKSKGDNIAQTLAYRYYTAYNAGYNYYYQLGGAVPRAGTRVYTSVKK